MKRFFPSIFILIYLLIGRENASNAQCTITTSISGNACAGHALTAITSSVPSSIAWQQNGVTVHTSYPSQWSSGITVAGGNGNGNASNQFGSFITGVAVDKAGNIYICDNNNWRVQKWAPGAISGVTVAGGNGEGNAANQFDYPQDVFIDDTGNLYVVDEGNARIQKWRPGATSGVTVAGGNLNGSDANQFWGAFQVVVDKEGNIYVADGNNYRVQKWAPGATSGVTVAGGNGQGSANNQISYTSYIFVDDSENVYVSDEFNHRVMKWAPGATSGVTVAGGNGGGVAANQLYYPTGIFVDGSGNIFTANESFNSTSSRILEWRKGATEGIKVAGGSNYGDPDYFANGDMTIDRNGNILAIDQSIDRILQFSLTNANYGYTPASSGNYQAIATDFYSSCTAASNSISVAPAPVINSSVNGNLCGGSGVTLTASGGTTFTWQPGNLVGAIQTFYPTITTTYSVSSDVNSCVSEITIPVLPAPSISISGNACTNHPLTASVNKIPASIQWQKNGVTQETDPPVWNTTGSTVAGGNGDGAASNQIGAGFLGIFADASGNIYVADETNQRVQKWAPGATSGVTVAGGNGAGSSSAQLSFPEGIYVDASGNIYIADAGNHRVEEWTPGASSGITVAGGNGQGGDNTQLSNPATVSVDAAGNVYVLDRGNDRVQKWAPGASSGVTVAGGNGEGTNSNQIDAGTGLFVDEDGNVYVDEWYSGRVQKWAPGATSGVPIMTNLDLPYGLWRDAAGYFYVMNEPFISPYYTSQVARGREGEYEYKTVIPASYGSAPDQLAQAYNGCFDAQGNMYIWDNGNHRVQKFTPASINTTYSPPSFGDYTAVATDFSGCSATSNTIHATTSPVVSSPTLSICNGSSTVLSVAGGAGFTWNPGGENGSSVTVSPTSSTAYTVTNDTSNCQSTVMVNVNPLITTTLAGPNCLGSGNLSASIGSTPLQLDWKLNGNTIQSTTASYSYLTSSVVFGGNGNGTGLNQLGAPEHMCFDDAGNLYISELANSRVTKWAPGATQGVIVAGGNGQGSNDNQITWPFGVFVDHSGNLYVSDWINHRVQKWVQGATSGVTVAGGNGEGSALNQLDFPSGIDVDGAGNIYIADEDNSRVVEWAPGAAQGVIVAGGNGQGSAANQFNRPIDVHVDGSGNIYVCDDNNHRIQKWAPGATSGVTIAGDGTLGYGPVELNYPEGFDFDGAGNMYIMNSYYNTIWKWAPGATQGVYLAAYCCSGQGSLQDATDVAIDMNGNLYACDVGADKIVKYPVNNFSTIYNPTSVGAYSVVATSFAGCAATSNTVNIHLVPTISLTGNQSYCTGSTTILDAGSHQTYSWSTGSTNESETFGASGKYAITVSDSGCSKTDSFSINNATPQVQATASQTSVCNGQSTTLNVQLLSGNGSGNSYSWSPGNLSGASVSVTPSVTTTYTLTAINSGCSSTSSVTVNLTSPLGDPAVFGNNVWNVYAWNAGGQYDYGQSWNTNYAGYYVDTTLNFNSTSRWDQATSPSNATGYQGCHVQVDNMSWSAKRKGFPCGVYQIDMPLHDDEAQLLVNGIVVSTNYCCGNVNNLWTGELGANSTVEFKVTEGGGYSNGALNFTIVPVPIIANGPSTICPGYSLPISIDTTDAASYVWSTGETTSTIDVSTAGTYTVNVNYRSGCSSSNSFALSVNPMDTPALISNTGFAFCPLNGYVDAQVTNYNSQLNYNWNSQNVYDYGGGYFFIGLGGNYTLTSSDALGCSAQAHVSISGPPGADSIFGNNVWKVNAYSDGNQSDYGYSWLPQDYSGYYLDSSLNFNSQNKWDENSNPSTAPGYQGCSINDDYMSWSAKRQGFPCGVYQIDVLNHDDEGELFINGVMVWSHDGCCDSHINVWTGPLNSSSKVEFKVTEGGGASNGALQFTLKDTASAFITISGNPIVCTGQSFTLNSIAGSGYLWSDGETTNPAHPAQSGSYSVTVTDAAGCSITSAPITVNILSQIAPVAHITTSPSAVCNWTQVTLLSDSATGNQWSTNDTTFQINTIAGGIYTLTVKNSTGCTAQSSIDIIAGFTPPAPPVATNSGPVCQNSPVDLTVNGLAPGGQAVSLDGSTYINVVQDIPETDFTIEMWVKTTDPNTGIFSATDDNSGTSDRSLFLQNGQLWVSLIYDIPWNSGFTINDGQWHHVALVVQSGVGQIVYVDGVSSGIGGYYDQSYFTWQTAFRIGNSQDAIHQSFNGQIDNVRIWSEAKSQDAIRNNLLLETPASTTNLVYEATLNGNLNALVGVNGTTSTGISYANPDYYTYTWTGGGAPPPSTSETQTIVSVASSGTYTVTASTAGGCNASPIASTSVTVTPSVNYYADADGDGYGSSSAVAISSCTNPGAGYVTNNTDCNDNNASVHPGATEICNGIDDNCNGQIDEGAGATYYADADGDGYGTSTSSVQACTAPAGYVSNNTDCNDANKNVHPGAPDICNGIDDNCNGVIDENAISAIVTPNGSVTFCAGTNLTLTANSGSGITYQWLKNNKNISGATKQTYTTAANGNYTVKENNSFSCTSTSSATTVTKAAKPAAVIIALGNLNICNTGSVTLQANAGTGLSYQWIKGNANIAGATARKYVATAVGTYKCIVTNASHCSKTSNGLKVTKNCGKESEDDINQVQPVLSIYPNPTQGKFILDLKTNEVSDGPAKVMILNIVGQIIYAENGSVVNGELQQEINFPVAASSGLYIAKVICENHTYEGKVIYQH